LAVVVQGTVSFGGSDVRGGPGGKCEEESGDEEEEEGE
jgi:hypothetical protein